MIKGCTPTDVFNHVRMLKEKGLTTKEAIEEIESTLRGKLPEHIKARIYQEVT